ncbi:response regulator [Thermovibrio sp.]
MKVLIAEDKETWHKLLEIVLSLRGIDVVHAYTPKEAINKAVSEKPDVAVVDVTLSTGTAYDVIKDITELGVPVIVIGHRAEGFDPEKARSLGAYAAVEKPFTVEDLLSVLRKLKKEKPSLELEEKAALVLPTVGEVKELVPEEKEEIEVVSLEESPVETIEIEEPYEEIAPAAVEEPLTLEEVEVKEEEEEIKPPPREKEAVEEVAKPVAEEISKVTEVSLPPEKVEEIVREIAWEVIPEIAEKVIREEVEKLIKSRLA